MNIKKNREDILGYDFPQISLKAHSLEDAINFQDIIPTIKEEEKKLIWILEILYHLLMKQIKLQKKFLVLLKKLEKI